ADTVRMVGRLARRLRQSLAEPGSLTEAACRYLADGGFADWARSRVWDGDPRPALAAACRRIAERVAQAREEGNRRFAKRLAGWTALGSSSDAIVPVEEVLVRVVAPLAEQTAVLMIVVDGMSVAVFQELMADLIGRGWAELGGGDVPARRPAVAALPTVT